MEDKVAEKLLELEERDLGREKMADIDKYSSIQDYVRDYVKYGAQFLDDYIIKKIETDSGYTSDPDPVTYLCCKVHTLFTSGNMSDNMPTLLLKKLGFVVTCMYCVNFFRNQDLQPFLQIKPCLDKISAMSAQSYSHWKCFCQDCETFKFTRHLCYFPVILPISGNIRLMCDNINRPDIE